jgi:DNA polymerase-3 subunit gamma/tau
MENFIVSALKYRPVTFDSVVGQDSVTTTLKNAIKNKHIAHAYLFHGPRGVGKTTCARIFAKTINCSDIGDNNEACDKCESCIAFNRSRSYNIHELDAASNNSVEDIRYLIDQVRIPPQIGKYSVYIIDEIHMLSANAFNAFLKTLEEPPAHAIFILATTEKHKIIPTILSRCQIYNFNRIKLNDIVGYLEFVAKSENVEADPEGLNIIAQKSDGAMRDALSIFDQIVSFAGNKFGYNDVIENLNVLDYDYYFRITEAILKTDYNVSLMIFNEVLDKGFDGHHFLNGISKHFRDLLVCKDPVTIELLETGASISERYKQQAALCKAGMLLAALEICNQFDINYKTSNNARLHVELALLQLCNAELKKKPDKNIEIMSGPTGATDHSGQKQVLSSKDTLFIPGASVQNNSKPTPQKIPIPSIKEALKKNAEQIQKDSQQPSQVSEKKAEYFTGEKNTKFSQKELASAWSKFSNQMDESKNIISGMLSSITPELEENSLILVKVTDDIQQVAVNEVQAGLLEFLKKELNDDSLHIIIEPEESKEKKKVFFTDTDKFNYMAEKNPALLKLKQQFNLDFE